MQHPDLSVIICTYNRAHLLYRIFNDLNNQLFSDQQRFSFELILVDNNSIDDTKKVVHDFAIRSNFIVRYVFEPRQGKSFALNTGVAAAAAELLAFTDDDVIIDKKWLSSVYSAFCDYPRYNCFGGKILPILEKPLPNWLSVTDRKFRVYGGPLVSHDRGDEVKEYDDTMYVPVGCNMFVRRFLFEKFGGYSTKLGFYSQEALIYSEDSEIMFRFKRGGEPILHYPYALIQHPVPADRMRKSYFKKWWWGVGRGNARWLSVPQGAIRYFNIPRYMIRDFMINLLKWLIFLPSKKIYKRFYYELHLIYKLGMFFELYTNGD